MEKTSLHNLDDPSHVNTITITVDWEKIELRKPKNPSRVTVPIKLNYIKFNFGLFCLVR